MAITLKIGHRHPNVELSDPNTYEIEAKTKSDTL